jgi:hypothetical protein
MSAPAVASSAAAGSGTKRPLPGAAADSERRVQPRHFHFGPNPTATSGKGDAAAAEADQPPPCPAARLYRHALESIFGWLNQRELVAALQVSKSWLAAVKSMASLQLTVVRPSAPLRVLARSAMGRHVTQLGEDWSVTVTADLLSVVARLMPHLRGLSCYLERQWMPTEGPLTFPPGLRVLHLEICGAPASAEVNATLTAIRRLPLLESLTVYLPSFAEQLSFAPLASMPLLRHLRIVPSRHDVECSNAQVAELRGLPLLRELDVWPMPASLLRRLLAQPHELQWQRITPPNPLDDEVAALLPLLPSLTVLNESLPRVTCSRFYFLRQLPQLTRVVLNESSATGRIESLVAGLQRCGRIEVLGLGFKSLTATHLNELLPRLPRLHTLSLGFADITTLSFLAHPPMTRQLVVLQLSCCERLPLTELRHVHALRRLKDLLLCRSFNAPMDAHCQSLYTPPSVLLPQLQDFDYEQP